MLLILFLVNFNKTEVLDYKVRDFFVRIRGNRYNLIYYFSRFITQFGYFLIVIPVGWFIFYYGASIKTYILVGCIAFSNLTNYIIKVLIKRERPDKDLHWQDEGTYSFPSGHSINAMAVYGLIAYFIYKSHIEKKKKIVYISLLLTLIIFIGLSRLVNSVHYFTDVLAGMLEGVFFIIISSYIYNLMKAYNIDKEPMLF